MLKRNNISVMVIGTGVLSLIVLISLVYAVFTGQLNITGTAVGRDSKWDIHFENVSNIATTGTAKVLDNHQPTINSNNPTQIQDYEVSLTSPADSISFTFDVVNDGNYNAKVTSVSIGTPECTSTDTTSATNMCNNLTYSITYSSGATIQTNDVVYAKETVTMKVTLIFSDINDPSLLPTAGVSISNLGIQINFEQQGGAEVDPVTGIVQNNKVYHQGDKITLNNESYTIIANSGAGIDYVVAIKDKPLTVSEVNLYGEVGTESNHVNRYTESSVGTSNQLTGGYGGIAFYSSETCGYVDGSLVTTDCRTNYDNSDVKYVVDNWANDKFTSNELEEVDGYSARLITLQESQNFGCTGSNLSCRSAIFSNTIYSWEVIIHWTMTMSGNTPYVLEHKIYLLASYKNKYFTGVGLRPVINVYKSALETNNNNNE